MATKPLAIFDGDDTLWRVEELYDDALARAEHAVDAAGMPGSQWRRLQRELDLLNVETMGMSPTRFPTSSREALVRLFDVVHRPVDRALVDLVVEISGSVFEMKAPVVPGAHETLAQLQPALHLVLLTKGDKMVQNRRIADSGLASYFDRVQIVPDKNIGVFKGLIAEYKVKANRAWSIGNSLPSDINPALRAGAHAIWIDAHVWEHERREKAEQDPQLVVLEDIRDVVQTILESIAIAPGA